MAAIPENKRRGVSAVVGAYLFVAVLGFLGLVFIVEGARQAVLYGWPGPYSTSLRQAQAEEEIFGVSLGVVICVFWLGVGMALGTLVAYRQRVPVLRALIVGPLGVIVVWIVTIVAFWTIGL